MKLRFAIIVIFSVLIFDQLTKFFLQRALFMGREIKLLGDFFKLRLTFNTGAAFSILLDSNMLLIFLSGIILTLLLFYLYKEKDKRFPIGLVIGGALGNLIDRFVYGAVVDFVDIWIWPVFNFADVAISIGVIFLVIDYFFKE
ncbi:MAG: signal peptidase II [Nanobdellota archaeon]